MTLHLLTGSAFKIATAQLALTPFGIEVAPVKLPLPEIQAHSNEEIARHSALEAAKQLGHPVAREDHGFVLNAFPGWPGPYMAYTEPALPPQDVLNLIGKNDRTGHFAVALAYATPAGEVLQFSFQVPIRIASELRSGSTSYNWDGIIILDQEQRTLSELTKEERYPFFTQNFKKLAKVILERST